MSEVTLHGVWDSPFTFRVIWALKLKGITYNYIEEDINNKSDLLLLYNPVHRKVPVLVHDGRPICESTIIIQYLDDTWPNKPLLPRDPYQRALARFWVKFAEDEGSKIWRVFGSVGERQEKAKNEFSEMLRTIENEALIGEKMWFGGEEIGIVDIAFGWMAFWLGVIEDVLEMKLIEAKEFPRLNIWINNFKKVSFINQNLPPRDAMFSHFKGLRQKFVA